MFRSASSPPELTLSGTASHVIRAIARLRSLIRITGLISLAVCLAGCLSAPRAHIAGSSASGRLLHETGRAVLMIDSSRAGNCHEWPHIFAEPMVSDKPGVIVERWRLERCGEIRYYRISYTPTRAIRGEGVAVREEKPAVPATPTPKPQLPQGVEVTPTPPPAQALPQAPPANSWDMPTPVAPAGKPGTPPPVTNNQPPQW